MNICQGSYATEWNALIEKHYIDADWCSIENYYLLMKIASYLLLGDSSDLKSVGSLVMKSSHSFDQDTWEVWGEGQGNEKPLCKENNKLEEGQGSQEVGIWYN